MECRNITLTLDKAQEFYNSGNTALREVALQAFTEDELTAKNFKCIKTFEDACKALNIEPEKIEQMLRGHYGANLFSKTPASIGALKLNIIRQALNKGQKMELTKGDIYYPQIRFVPKGNTFYSDELKDGSMVKAGTIREANCNTYDVLGGLADYGGPAGLGYFRSYDSVGAATAYIGFLGCASREIAGHMSRYFAREIFDAMYGDFVDYKWV